MMFRRQRQTVRKNQPLKQRQTRRQGRQLSVFQRLMRWAVVVGVVVVSLVGFWGFERVESVLTSLTSVEQVSIVGLKTVQRGEILSELSLAPETSLLDIEPDVMIADLETHPWIRTASVQRVFPHTLAIRVVEREPAAILQSSKAHYLLDDQAHILAVVDGNQNPDLPRLRGAPSVFPSPKNEGIQQQVRDGIRVAHLLSETFHVVPTVNVEKAKMIVADLQDLRFQFSDSIDLQWKRFQSLYPSIQSQINHEATEIDLRYVGKVILRKRE